MDAETGSATPRGRGEAKPESPLALHSDDGESAPHLADKAKAEAMRANMSAIATADVQDLHTTGTLLGVATVGNDVDVTTSAVGVVSAQGDATLHQAVAWALIGKGDVSVDQGGSWVTIAHDYNVQSGVAGTVVATQATVSRGWIGFLLAPRATLSDDSRVLIGTIPALIIGGAIVLGFALLAMAGVRTARNAMAWRPKLPGLTWE